MMSIFSISFGSITLKSDPIFTPSTITRGELLPFVVIPRILIFNEAPGDPEFAVTWTPAAFPVKASSILAGFFSAILSAFKEENAPDTNSFLWLP